MKPFLTKPLKTTAAAAAAVAAGIAALALNGGAAAVAADTPPPAVEDFKYPGADQLLEDKNIRLVSGDGNIVHADCAEPVTGDVGVMHVYTTDIDVNDDGHVCFKALAPVGILSLEVPAVYEIRGDGRAGTGAGHDITAIIKPEGGSQVSVDIDSDGSTPVGIGASPDPNEPPTTLLQLKVTG